MIISCPLPSAQEDSCDGPQESSIHSEDSIDLDLPLDGKSEDFGPLPKPQTSFYTRGKPFSLAKRGNFAPRLRGGAIGKKAFSSSKKRGQTVPVRRGRGNGRGYRGYFNYQSVTLQVMHCFDSVVFSGNCNIHHMVECIFCTNESKYESGSSNYKQSMEELKLSNFHGRKVKASRPPLHPLNCVWKVQTEDMS